MNRGASGPHKKKPRVAETTVHQYPEPLVNAEDEVSHQRNLKLLTDEMEKPRPRYDVLKDLMRRTYSGRWDAFINSGEPSSLSEYFQMYPLLKKSTFVSYFVLGYAFLYRM